MRAGRRKRCALVINDYTHEAGVRELERQIGAVCRDGRGAVLRVARRNTSK